MKKLVFLLVLCLFSMAADATEIHIPAKPDSSLCDAANVFTDLETHLIYYKIDDVKKRNYGLGIYVLTIDPSYLPHLDTFITLLCNKWQICGNDNSCLIVLAKNNSHDRYLFTGQLLSGRFNDTINDYIASIAHSQYKTESGSAPDARELVEGMLDMINDRLSASSSSDDYNKELLDFKKGYGKTNLSGLFSSFDLYLILKVIAILVGLIGGIVVGANALRKV